MDAKQFAEKVDELFKVRKEKQDKIAYDQQVRAFIFEELAKE